MSKTPEQLQKLHEALKTSIGADGFVTLDSLEHPECLILGSPQASEHDDFYIHITVAKHHPERFTYRVLSDVSSDNTGQYFVIVAKEEAFSGEMIEAVYLWLAPATLWYRK